MEQLLPLVLRKFINTELHLSLFQLISWEWNIAIFNLIVATCQLGGAAWLILHCLQCLKTNWFNLYMIDDKLVESWFQYLFQYKTLFVNKS